MKSGLLFIALVTSLPAAAPAGSEVHAKLLDSNQLLCTNCFFGASKYYYCFEADQKVLIGYQKVPVLNWQDPASNDLTKVHKSWKPLNAEGQSIPLRYDEKDIWVTRPDGKTVKLKQDYSTDIFVNNPDCRKAVRNKSQ